MTEVLDVWELGDDDDDEVVGADFDVWGGGAAEDGEDGRVAVGDSEGAGSGRPLGRRGGRRRGRWRSGAAVGVVVVLAAAVAATVVGRVTATAGDVGGRASLDGAAVGAGRGGEVEQAATAVPAALDAWGRFASSGDPGVLAGTFDTGGPQFLRLQGEATAVAAKAGGPPYRFSADVVAVEPGRGGDERIVAADVVVSRAGEADQRFSWDLVMRRHQQDGPWMLWTVREHAASASTTLGGAP